MRWVGARAVDPRWRAWLRGVPVILSLSADSCYILAMSIETVAVATWPRPRGYANGAVGVGRPLHIAGQIGWDANEQFASRELLPQFAQALRNVAAVVAAAGGAVTDIATMTIYVTDIAAYRTALPQFGEIWRDVMGKHFPAMALVAVTALVEPMACVEIQAVAYLA